MDIKVLTSAYSDLKKGKAFYEYQAKDLGSYFLDFIFSDIDSLILYAENHQRTYGFYRLLSKRFPYAIYYKMTNTQVTIWRVLDCRQNPSNY